ncbi:MAG TPA: DUF4115 domain-containing protein, partial [Vicinamibacterales bacterium]|nr:DUF4115 domain-containing protein [Vicinamibacterales bacterium]
APPAPIEALACDLEAVDVVWVAARADGRRVVYRLLRPGERVSIRAQEEIRLRVGNAAALRYAINGRSGPPLGRPGEVRTLRISRETLERLVTAASTDATRPSAASARPFQALRDRP